MPKLENNNSNNNIIKWSASRTNCFQNCKLQYKYNYIEKWDSSDTEGIEVTSKGLAFHETVEQYNTGMSREEIFRILENKIKEYNVDETVYDEHEPLERFLCFWDKFVKPKELMGYTVKKESWANGEVDGNYFTGALDLCLEAADRIIIYDYKSSGSMSTAHHKNQQVLYAYLKGKERGWTNKQIAENVKLNIFFAFGKVNESLTTPEQRMVASVKELKFTEADLDFVIKDFYLKNINESKQIDWQTITPESGTVGFLCKWCKYAGGIKDDKTGFQGCKSSYDAGFVQKRGVVFTKRI